MDWQTTSTGSPAQPPMDSTRVKSLGLERLVFFTDAVFAIAITLLALEIRLPAGETALTERQLAGQLLRMWPQYLAYILSFLVIGVFWMGHHRRFSHIERLDRRLMWLNLLLLMSVAFLPFPTRLISEYGNRTATVFYALAMSVTGLLSAAAWAYASSGHRLVSAGLSDQEIRSERLRSLLIPLVFLLSTGPALASPEAAQFSWLLFLIPAVYLSR